MPSGAVYRRAALLVDFDNIFSSLKSVDPSAAHVFATDPMRWATWLEERLGAIGPDVDETTPRMVLGSQMAIRHSGYAMAVCLKCDNRFAVRQKMPMCGKAIAEKGMNM